MPASSAYGYTSLDDPSTQFRLLELDCSLDSGSVLTGSLSVHKIARLKEPSGTIIRKQLRLPSYIAVSYVWGTGSDSYPTEEIILDGRRFPVSANLHAALNRARSEATSFLRLWVDAICINQADDREKSAQIAIMCDIYHFAIFVAVWLGEATAESDRVTEFINKLTLGDFEISVNDFNRRRVEKETDYQSKGQKKRPLTEAMVAQSEQLLMKGFAKVSFGILKAVHIGSDIYVNHVDGSAKHKQQNADFHNNWARQLRELSQSWMPNKQNLKNVQDENFHEMAALIDKVLFLDNEYFNRMWTLQEVCVANHGAVWIVGTLFCTMISVFGYMQREFGISSSSARTVTTLMDINSKFIKGEVLSLRVLLVLSAGRKSQDPRDRLYALQGLMNDKINPLLQPDYTKSVAEVYANTTRYLIFAEKSLNIICGQQLHNRLPELPTWVPDFRHFALEKGSLVDPNGQNVIYRASLSEEYQVLQDPFYLKDEWQTLTVTGICLDTVSLLSDTLVPSGKSQTVGFEQIEISWVAKLLQSREWRLEELEAISRVSGLLRRYSEFYQSLNRATFGTLNPDKLQELQSITEIVIHETGDIFDLHINYLMTLLCGRIAPETRCSKEELVKQMTRLCVADQEGIQAFENLCKALDDGTRGRRLGMSDKKQMGAVPEMTKEGDKICILKGCSVPVVLRETDNINKFELVGECYWHGFMDGEALEKCDGDEPAMHEFILV